MFPIITSITLRIMDKGMNTATRVHTCASPFRLPNLSRPHADHIMHQMPALATKCSSTSKRTPSSPDMAPSKRPSVTTCHNANIKVPACSCETAQDSKSAIHCNSCTWLNCYRYLTHWYRICSTYLSTFARFALSSG